VIHVTGTKGKGSTCAFVESILRSHGLKTGLFTSPHLVSVRERIRIGGNPIDRNTFANHFWQCCVQLEQTKTTEFPRLPSYFRFLTLMALHVFIAEKVDIAIVEVGVGGRTDATNIFDSPVVCGISSIGYDHMNVLGNTLKEIAFEKSGIFKYGIPALISPQKEEALVMLKRRAMELIVTPPFCNLPIIFPSEFLDESSLGLSGEHQILNASLAIGLCKVFLFGNQISPSSGMNWIDELRLNELPEAFLQGLRECRWPGRCQKIYLEGHNINLYLDGAHTDESIELCLKWYQSRVENANSEHSICVLVFNCTENRDPKNLLSPLAKCSLFQQVFFTGNDTGRKHVLQVRRYQEQNGFALSWQHRIHDAWKSLKSVFSPTINVCSTIPQVIECLFQYERLHPTTTVHVLITGSLYLVGGWIEFLSLNPLLVQETNGQRKSIVQMAEDDIYI